MELNKDVLNAFSIKPKNIKKHKGLYIIDTYENRYIIRTIKSNENFIRESQKIIKYLNKNNINTIDSYKLTTEGEPFYIFNNEIYVVSKYLPLISNDFTNKNNLLNTASFLSKFHKAIEKTDINLVAPKTLLDEYSENISDIKSIKKRVINQKTIKEFDLLFLKSSNMYLEKMIQSYEQLNCDYFKNRLLNSKKNLSISHNNIKEENWG